MVMMIILKDEIDRMIGDDKDYVNVEKGLSHNVIER